jgi:hypothetical protein
MTARPGTAARGSGLTVTKPGSLTVPSSGRGTPGRLGPVNRSRLLALVRPSIS